MKEIRRYFHDNCSCRDGCLAFQERPLNQRVSAILDRDEVVFFCLDGLKFVWCYRGGVRKMNVLAKGWKFVE